MKNLKKFLIIILIIIVVAVGITAFVLLNKKADTEELKTIRVNEVTRSVFYAPQYVAIANGYFAEEGLNIELTTGQGADKVMTAVIADQSDIGFAGPEAAIYIYNEGKEDYAQVFAQMTQKDGSFLVSKEPTDNFSWQDLKGKTVIPGRKGGVPYMTFEYVLKQNGLNPQKDLVLDDSIKFDLMAGAFAGGEAEYVTLFEPTASAIEQAKSGYVVSSIGAEAGSIPYTCYFTTKSYMNKNKDLIQHFTNAIYKGQLWVKSHSDKEVASSIKSFFPGTEISSLETVTKNYRKIDAFASTPAIKEEDAARLMDIMQDYDKSLLPTRPPFNTIVNNDFAKTSMEKLK